MLSITRSTEQNQFDYRFDADAFARSKGFLDEADFNASCDLIAAVYELSLLAKQIEVHKARIAYLAEVQS